MSEFELIERLRRHNRVGRDDVIQGIGDDAARLRVPDGVELVVTVDTLIGGVHFPAGTSPHAIGFKSLAVNLSDLAAMGAEPAWVTLALSLPEANPDWLDLFAEGFFTLAEQHRVVLAGGDTTRGPLSVTVQAHGFLPPGRALTRGGARPGDTVCVTGHLGQAGLELSRLEGRAVTRTPVNRLNYPIPRVEAGLALRGIASAAIDISDGLIADLGHILQASGAGAQIMLDALPLSPDMLAEPDRAAMLQQALTAGDDYELCFTVGPEHLETVDALQHELNLPIKPIGTVEAQHGLRIHRPDGPPLEIASGGYDHFSGKKT